MNGEQQNKPQTAEKKVSKTQSVLREIASLALGIIIILGLSFLVTHYIGQRTKVVGHSMETTLSDGDQLIVDKISYRWRDPERFDIIIFPFQYEENTYYIKRIIGMPGETVQIDERGNIFIDGEVLEENYGLETILDPGMAIEPITLAEDEYFVMGDNRNNSTDSRYEVVGPIHREDIIGRAWLRIYPFDRITFIRHQ